MLALALLSLVVAVLCGVAIRLHWAGVLPQQPSRAVPRRRWHVDHRVYELALRHGFSYSRRRDALVLRRIGRRWGPVLKLRRSDEPQRVAAQDPPGSGVSQRG
jgi:hypothetical protein